MKTIGIIREGKFPPDYRVVLNPDQCRIISRDFPLEIVVESSPNRCFSDAAYREAGVPVGNDISGCDILLGIKEVPAHQLLYGKTYLFFSHTIKEQPANRHLLRTVVEKGIRLIDYELITDPGGKRLIAFGEFAGMVGAHNALYTWGMRSGQFDLPRMYSLSGYREASALYKKFQWPPLKIVLTGTGRVGNGAARVLADMGFQRMEPDKFLSTSPSIPAFVQLRSSDYLVHEAGKSFDREDFHRRPASYRLNFQPWLESADIFINGIFWDYRAPVFFTREDMLSPSFRVRVIADLTCDLAPRSSVPSTLRASTISDPVYSYRPDTGIESGPLDPRGIAVMAIDNLPNEIARDASTYFGERFLQQVLPDLLAGDTPMIRRATIAEKGALTPAFSYLSDYIAI